MNKNDIKSNTTKKKLCDTYIEIYSTKNIETITIKEITDKAGYNRGTFYIHYRDVYDMHEKIRNDLIDKFAEMIQRNISNFKTNSFDDIFKLLMNFYVKNEEYIIPLINQDPNFTEKLKQLIKPNLYNLFNKNLDDNKITDYLINYHLSGVIGILNFWIENKKSVSINELFNILQNVSTKGIITVFKYI